MRWNHLTSIILPVHMAYLMHGGFSSRRAADFFPTTKSNFLRADVVRTDCFPNFFQLVISYSIGAYTDRKGLISRYYIEWPTTP
jgi:hypothetical protein